MRQSAMQRFEQWLEQYRNFEKNPEKDFFRLDTMRYLCERFGNPQNAYKSIHVAGSKGKGSVSVFCASVLEEAGFKTGLYLSPHVADIRERISGPFSFLSETEYEKAVDAFIPAAESFIKEAGYEKAKPTWFELMTLFAFFCFRSCGMEWVVFETGLGGRLDATNVLLPQVCAITQIELEHTEYLGTTLQAIAGEKAGIIKQGIPVCIAPQKNEVQNVFEHKAREMQVPILCISDAANINYKSGNLSGAPRGGDDVGSNFGSAAEISFSAEKLRQFEKAYGRHLSFLRPLTAHLKLQGEFQAENAATAAAAVKLALPDIDERIIERGLEKAFLPARFETVRLPVQNGTLTIVIDGCHTANSMKGTLETFYAHFGAQCHLLFACAADKDVESMARLIKDSPCSFSRIALTVPGSAKRSDYEKTVRAFSSYSESASAAVVHADKDFGRAIRQAIDCAAKENKTLLCAGSFYLAGEVKNAIREFNPAV